MTIVIMELLGMLAIGILLGMGGQSVRLKEECKKGKEYACLADKKLHSFKDVPDSKKN